MADQPKKMYVGGQIDAEDYRRFYRLGVNLGMTVADLTPIAVKYYMAMAEQDDETKTPLDIKFHKRLMIARQGADTENALRELAVAYMMNPNDQTAEMLTISAEEAGYTREEVLHWIEEDKLSPIGNNSTVLDHAIEFLSRMIEPGKEYESIAIVEKAAEQGFTESTLNAAKRKLNIRSERRSKCWAWIRDAEK